MNFQVPQFIEIEDKIFGPLTFRQFLYVAGGAGLSFLEWAWIPVRFIAILFILPTIGAALALAFYKINNRPLIFVLEAAFRYLLATKLYLWKQRAGSGAAAAAEAKKETAGAAAAKGFTLPKLSTSRLKDLAWSLDVKEKIQ